jgi:hypothetical protein
MADPAPCGTILSMAASLHLTPRRALIEVPSARQAVSKDPVVRRYRLARVSPYTRPDPTLDRFAHLRRSHD